MACQRCKSKRVAHINGKCRDLCFFRVGKGKEHDGYVPTDIGLEDGYGDYIEFSYCLDCGQIQGKFPVPECAVERGEDG